VLLFDQHVDSFSRIGTALRLKAKGGGFCEDLETALHDSPWKKGVGGLRLGDGEKLLFRLCFGRLMAGRSSNLLCISRR
jgi:hypothetical protein